MSNVSIYEKNWTNLVFEDKNKEYGAYQLRQENPRTTLLAFFIGTLFILSLVGFWLLLSSFNGKPVDEPIQDPDIQITPVVYNPIDPVKPVKPKVEQQQHSSVEPVVSQHMVVAATPDVTVDVAQNKNQNNIPVDTPTDTGGGSEGPAAPSTVNYAPPVIDNKIRTTVELDRMPEYPGGIKNFYKDVGNAIDRNNLEDITSSNVIMGFVVERDGSLSDIRVLRGSDKILEKEAIRALKSMKVKWTPGMLDGQKVRTQYTLPIKVAD